MKYILFGTDELSLQAAEFLGKENIEYFFDPSYAGNELRMIPVIKDEEVLKRDSEFCKTVLTWKDIKHITTAVEMMTRANVGYSLFEEAAADVIEAEAKAYDRLNTREAFAYDIDRKCFSQGTGCHRLERSITISGRTFGAPGTYIN